MFNVTAEAMRFSSIGRTSIYFKTSLDGGELAINSSALSSEAVGLLRGSL